jgi:RimJ/RimL family protein N-acetyltransferase
MTSAPPVLETERLLLRGYGVEDFTESAAMWSDAAVTRSIGGKPFSPEEVWAKILSCAGHWALLGYGYWVARERATRRFVGQVGFADLKRTLVPALGDAPEAGWALAGWAWGKGYATEALRGALGWLEKERGPTRTVCMIGPENAASRRVAEKAGFGEWQRTSYKGEPVVLFERAPSRHSPR